MTSPGPEEEDPQRLSDEERADDLVRSHHKPARSAAKQQQAKSSTGDNVRLQRMSDALDKFLDLIDHQATKENVALALPQIKEQYLENLRGQFITELKDVIRAEKDVLVERYGVAPRLESLSRMCVEADARASSGREPREYGDAYRPTLDIATALHAKSIPAQRRRVASLERELTELARDNDAQHTRLTATLQRTEERRTDASTALDRLEQTVNALTDAQGASATGSRNNNNASDDDIRSEVAALLAALGPSSR
ncbi:hypothetical protein FA10DRAFT_268854 [Acaromyces ingoldii]|uniref:Nnf1-domain-containing protein n=1 Tax=Acaromyces ingoldii TaxID=215250 RepID=A0A316YHL1_9BASI|nr:hypothetical protein FA10DRAFT_268854 [Acaromyces ingoldii]PWN88689.1 hypothetical protein FA10DRAFT_268854 [Acaromyces ingoldii]